MIIDPKDRVRSATALRPSVDDTLVSRVREPDMTPPWFDKLVGEMGGEHAVKLSKDERCAYSLRARYGFLQLHSQIQDHMVLREFDLSIHYMDAEPVVIGCTDLYPILVSAAIPDRSFFAFTATAPSMTINDPNVYWPIRFSVNEETMISMYLDGTTPRATRFRLDIHHVRFFLEETWYGIQNRDEHGCGIGPNVMGLKTSSTMNQLLAA